MGKISDEIRMFVKRSYADEHMDPKELLALAERIDSELVELPRDRDGVPIHVGETLYLPSGVKVDVTRIFIGQGEPNIECVEFLKTKFLFSRQAKDFTHTTPDSWESIADELEDWSEDNRVNGNREVFDRAADLADRIRRLAAKED